MILLLTIFVLSVLVVSIVSNSDYDSDEDSQWNGGICEECGTEWEYIRTREDGRHVYLCQCEFVHVYITNRDVEYK